MPDDEFEYFTPDPTIPAQNVLITDRVVLNPQYMLVTATTMVDYVASYLPGWTNTRTWVLTTPDISHETNFCFYLNYCDEGGGSDQPEFEEGVQSIIFLLDGKLSLSIDGDKYSLEKGGYSYIPPDVKWSLQNRSDNISKFIWVRKFYERIIGFEPKVLVGQEEDLPRDFGVGDGNTWSRHLIPINDMAYDMHININTFNPGRFIPTIEAHVMQHGLYMLQGQGMYLLNDTWHEVKAGDYIWMHAWCPQACYAGGTIPMRYLLYKNVNRQFYLNHR